MQPKKFTGKLIAIDMYNCGVNELNNTEKAQELLLAGCEEFHMENKHVICVRPSTAIRPKSRCLTAATLAANTI